MLPKIVGFLLNILSFFLSKSATKIALKLFSVPRKGRITEEQSAFLETASKEILFYNNSQIMTYIWLGNKDTILLIHGWESNAGRWMELITALQKKSFNIVAFDAPAHGNSGSNLFNVALYSEFINVVSKHFKPNVMIAHSMGGMATAFSISKYQMGTIQKIILLGAPCKYTDVVTRYVSMMGYNKRIILQLNKALIERLGYTPESFSTAKNIENIRAEGLIIHDKADDVIPYQDALLIKNSLKNSELMTTKGLGHSLKDASVNSKIVYFIHP
jgi:pimeloyl-ACP methyl ester carboxylesterase